MENNLILAALQERLSRCSSLYPVQPKQILWQEEQDHQIPAHSSFRIFHPDYLSSSVHLSLCCLLVFICLLSTPWKSVSLKWFLHPSVINIIWANTLNLNSNLSSKISNYTLAFRTIRLFGNPSTQKVGWLKYFKNLMITRIWNLSFEDFISPSTLLIGIGGKT